MSEHNYVITLAKQPRGYWLATLLDASTGHVVDDTLVGWNPWGCIMFAVERAHQYGPTSKARRLPFIYGSKRAFVDVAAYGTRAWDHAAAKRVAARLGAK